MGIADTEDTIVALSSSAYGAARGIVRLSGAGAFECLGKVVDNREGGRGCMERSGGLERSEYSERSEYPEPLERLECLMVADSWRWFRVRLVLGESVLCPAVVYVFKGPRSYTGQDMAELHVPGSVAVLEMLTERLLAKGARMAGPGEFTARAFLNGRIDLSQVQAVTEVISARNSAELRAAERLLDGELCRRCSEVTVMVRDMLGLIEAELDFSEQDIEFASVEELVSQARAIREKLRQLISDSVSWQKLHELPRVVLAGKANAGKSSLMNALLGWDRSIVNDGSGTTRDVLTATMNWQGYECELIDTAGLDDTDDAGKLGVIAGKGDKGDKDDKSNHSDNDIGSINGVGSINGIGNTGGSGDSSGNGDSRDQVAKEQVRARGDGIEDLYNQSQRLSMEAIRTTDLVLWVFDVTDDDFWQGEISSGGMSTGISTGMSTGTSAKVPTGTSAEVLTEDMGAMIKVANKMDLLGEDKLGSLRDWADDNTVLVSAVRGDSIERLRGMIMQRLGFVDGGEQKSGDAVSCTADTLAVTAGQRRALEKALEGIEQLGEMLRVGGISHAKGISRPEETLRAEGRLCAEEALQTESVVRHDTEAGPELELVALELRGVLDELGSISGEVVDEDVLGSIFSRFCVGK